MQRSAFLFAFFSLLAFFSAALASPLPVQVVQEAREAIVELSVREVPVDHGILHREVTVDTESGTNLQILARENKLFEEYVQEMTGETNNASDPQDMEPRMCRGRTCF